jgi:hypothetical protein
MSDIQVRPAIFAPAPLRRRRKAKQDPAQWRGLAVFAAGAAIGALFAYACGGAPAGGRTASAMDPADKPPV